MDGGANVVGNLRDASGVVPEAGTNGDDSISGAVPDNPDGRVAVAGPSKAEGAGSGMTGSGMTSVGCESIGTSANGAEDPPLPYPPRSPLP